MGEKHIDDVGKIMGVLYKMSLRMSSILRNQKLFTSNLATERQLSATYAELLAIVVEITMTYHKRSKGMGMSFMLSYKLINFRNVLLER